MKSARKLFKQLGYNKRYKRGWSLVYEKTVNKVCLYFDLEEHDVYKGHPSLGGFCITYEELQAINQQINELGWK